MHLVKRRARVKEPDSDNIGAIGGRIPTKFCFLSHTRTHVRALAGDFNGWLEGVRGVCMCAARISGFNFESLLRCRRWEENKKRTTALLIHGMHKEKNKLTNKREHVNSEDGDPPSARKWVTDHTTTRDMLHACMHYWIRHGRTREQAAETIIIHHAPSVLLVPAKSMKLVTRTKKMEPTNKSNNTWTLQRKGSLVDEASSHHERRHRNASTSIITIDHALLFDRQQEIVAICMSG